MSAPVESVAPVATLYREVASGELQSRIVTVGPLQVHPDYLPFSGLRSDLEDVGLAQNAILPLMERFEENDGNPLLVKDIVPAPYPDTVPSRDPISDLNLLVRARLLGTEKNSQGLSMLFPLDDTYEMNHQQPFYKPDLVGLCVISGFAGVTSAALAMGNPHMGLAETYELTQLSQVGSAGFYVVGALVSAVRARRFYGRHGFETR